jgi:glyoxylase-like metal-dependent hydrolase (beta-lactamase superfamily II)
VRAERLTWRCEEIEADVLHVSLPRSQGRGFVNVQLLGGSDGWTLVDSGEDSDVTREALFGFLGQRGVLDDGISQIFLTHGHRDHTGLAAEVARLTGATVLAHEATLLGDPIDFEFLRRHGFESAPAARFAIPTHDPIPDGRFRPLSGGDILVAGSRRFRVIATPGHQRGHLCAIDEESGLLLSGDRILRIPTGVRLLTELDEDPLADHLRSYDVLRQLTVRRVLPGHGRAFVDVHAALDEDVRAHEDDIRVVLEAVPAGGADALAIARRAFGSWGHENIGLSALGRSLAVLRLLEGRGFVRADPAAFRVRFSQ